MRALLSWYLRFLLTCAGLGLVAGLVKTGMGIDLAIGHNGGIAAPTTNTLLMTAMAAGITVLRDLKMRNPE